VSLSIDAYCECGVRHRSMSSCPGRGGTQGAGHQLIFATARHRQCAGSSLGSPGSPSCASRTVTPPPTPPAVIVPARALPSLHSTRTVT
jgi:hypothetical protein